MGFLSKFEKKEPPTAETPAATAHFDPEKQNMPIESQNESSTPREAFQVTPEMEKRVLRKLDTRLVPLVMVLCANLPLSLVEESHLTAA